VLVKDDEISDIISTTSIRQLLYNVVPSVNSMRVGKNEPHFLFKGQRDEQEVMNMCTAYFCELQQLGTRVSRGRHDDFWVLDTSARVFAVDMR
jgi:hypothetical protein